MTTLYATMIGLGVVGCVAGLVWMRRTRHARRVWRQTRHDTSTTAIVLELEEKVLELEMRQRLERLGQHTLEPR